MTDTPTHQLSELRVACRHLVSRPLVLAERDPDAFGLIRRHEHALDRWFTQRFGYRLQVTADTARLFKRTWVPHRRPLMTAGGTSRPFTQREYTLLALALAAVAAGPDVISLRDLLHEIRSAATDAGVALTNEAADRRAIVVALKWMVDHGLAEEMHDRIDRYAADEDADAVLRIRPDRVALLPLPVLATAASAAELVDRSEARGATSRAWMRCQLLEDPVLYRDDLDPAEWAELRRRLSEESAIFFEMFDVTIEARAEGLAVIDEDTRLTDSVFPRVGTVGHAALLLLARATAGREPEAERPADVMLDRDEVDAIMTELVDAHRKYWSQLAEEPARLTDAVLDLLEDHHLVADQGDAVVILPAAWRYGIDEVVVDGGTSARESSDTDQGTLL
jgi:uncharacterized protein (TIGR02678 family)